MSKINMNDKFSQWKWNQHWDRSIDEAMAEIEREVRVRERCYDRWIQEGRVSRVDAHDRQERMISAIRLLRSLQEIQKAGSVEGGEILAESGGQVNPDHIVTPDEFNERAEAMRAAVG